MYGYHRIPFAQPDGALACIADLVSQLHTGCQFCFQSNVTSDASGPPTIRIAGHGYLGVPFSAIQLPGFKAAAADTSSTVWCLPADDIVKISSADWLKRMGIKAQAMLSQVGRAPVLEQSHTLRLRQLLVQLPGGQPHVLHDPSSSPGTLPQAAAKVVIQLPSDATGGGLVATCQGISLPLPPATLSTTLLCLTLQHATLSMQPITAGARAMLLFDLMSARDAAVPRPPRTSLQQVAQQLVAAMQRWGGEEQGEALLAFQLNGKYTRPQLLGAAGAAALAAQRQARQQQQQQQQQGVGVGAGAGQPGQQAAGQQAQQAVQPPPLFHLPNPWLLEEPMPMFDDPGIGPFDWRRPLRRRYAQRRQQQQRDAGEQADAAAGSEASGPQVQPEDFLVFSVLRQAQAMCSSMRLALAIATVPSYMLHEYPSGRSKVVGAVDVTSGELLPELEEVTMDCGSCLNMGADSGSLVPQHGDHGVREVPVLLLWPSSKQHLLAYQTQGSTALAALLARLQEAQAQAQQPQSSAAAAQAEALHREAHQVLQYYIHSRHVRRELWSVLQLPVLLACPKGLVALMMNNRGEMSRAFRSQSAHMASLHGFISQLGWQAVVQEVHSRLCERLPEELALATGVLVHLLNRFCIRSMAAMPGLVQAQDNLFAAMAMAEGGGGMQQAAGQQQLQQLQQQLLAMQQGGVAGGQAGVAAAAGPGAVAVGVDEGLAALAAHAAQQVQQAQAAQQAQHAQQEQEGQQPLPQPQQQALLQLAQLLVACISSLSDRQLMQSLEGLFQHTFDSSLGMDQRLSQLYEQVQETNYAIDWTMAGPLLACLYRLQATDLMRALLARLRACSSFHSCHRLSAVVLMAASWLGVGSMRAQPGSCSLLLEMVEQVLSQERQALGALQAVPADSKSFGVKLCCRCDECGLMQRWLNSGHERMLVPASGRMTCSPLVLEVELPDWSDSIRAEPVDDDHYGAMWLVKQDMQAWRQARATAGGLVVGALEALRADMMALPA